MANTPTAYDRRAEQLALPLMFSKSFDHPAESFRRKPAVLEAVRATLKQCERRGLTRDQIADEMSRLLGENVTKNHLANWAAESKNGYRMPLEWAAAFCLITNDNSAIKAAFRGSGINVLDDADIVYFEIGKAIEEKRERDAKLKESRNRLKEIKMREGI